MLKHMLMDPAFPDLVADWAANEKPASATCANDNGQEATDDLADPLLTLLGKQEIAATRLW
jgi:hypothetical protein